MTLNWGILATGRIAHAMALAITSTPGNRLIAVASRDLQQAEAFAGQYGPDVRAYGNYAALLADDTVEVVYVATPHPLHAQWTLQALHAGKHVLCEKPLGLNQAQVMAMIHAARSNGRFLMEAFMYRCHPQTRIVRRLIQAGAIGEIRHISANFGYHTAFQPGSRLFENTLGGGGILDVGCYPVSMARYLLQEEPLTVMAHGHLGETGVDEWSSALLGFSRGVSAQLGTSIGVGLDNSVRISGSAGYIHLPAPWLPSDPSGNWRFEISRSGRSEYISGTSKPLYVLEVEAVAQAITAGHLEAPAMNWNDSLGNARTLDAWRSAIGLEYTEEAAASHRGPLSPLRRSTTSSAPITRGKVKALAQEMSHLVMGCDNQPNPSHAGVMWDHYFECGGNAFDTAFVYGNGIMETYLGHWHRQRGVRNDMVIIGKGAHTPDCQPDKIAPQLDITLDRLQTDHVDVYFLHRDNVDVPVGEFIDALNTEVARGRIKVFGGSNWTQARVLAANTYATGQGKQGFSAVSNNLSLARMVTPIWPGVESSWAPDYRAYLQHSGIALMPWSSQARGFFTPWVDAVLADQGERAAGGTRVEPTIDELKRTWFSEDNFERRRRAIALAAQRGTSAINVALAYVLQQPFSVFALIGPRTLDELDSCIQALNLKLTPGERAWLTLDADRP